MKVVSELKVQIFADGADQESMLRLYRNPLIKGFTTNPTLMRASGVKDYRGFARELLRLIPDRPICFEVFADDFENMERQALEIANWGDNVYVKVPVTNTRSQTSHEVAKRLAHAGIKLNVTAVMTLAQVRDIAPFLAQSPSSYISVFAGRIADTGRDPMPHMAAAVALLSAYPNLQLIWASSRELLNIFQADQAGCHVITVAHDLLKKLELVGRSLEEYSLATVKMFHDDARKSGFSL